jgi:hypothetical protein
MNSSEAATPPQAGNMRKADFREYTEVSLYERDQRGLNSPYREADLEFMRFLIPPGKRVLELGGGRGDLLANFITNRCFAYLFSDLVNTRLTRCGKAESQDHRNAHPLQGAHVRRDPDLALSRRLAAAENGVVRLSQAQGGLIAGWGRWPD